MELMRQFLAASSLFLGHILKLTFYILIFVSLQDEGVVMGTVQRDGRGPALFPDTGCVHG